MHVVRTFQSLPCGSGFSLKDALLIIDDDAGQRRRAWQGVTPTECVPRVLFRSVTSTLNRAGDDVVTGADEHNRQHKNHIAAQNVHEWVAPLGGVNGALG